jgi:hypothetical protein
MKITKSQLKQLIKEEMSNLLVEGQFKDEDRLEQYIRANPLRGLTVPLSIMVFAAQSQRGLWGHSGSPEEAIAAYDKLRRIMNPDDQSHLAAYREY